MDGCWDICSHSSLLAGETPRCHEGLGGSIELRRPHRLVIELEGILYDDSAWERWLFQLLTRFGVHSSFSRFRIVWRRDYFAQVTTGQTCIETALRQCLAALGLSGGQIHEACAAAVSRHRRDFEHPVLFPGVTSALRGIAESGVRLAAVHRGIRVCAEWRRTLQHWRLATLFQQVFAWPEGAHDGGVDAVPLAIDGALQGDSWYITSDSLRAQNLSDHGARGITCGPGQDVATVNDLENLVRQSQPHESWRRAA
jgi:hypothetical protein